MTEKGTTNWNGSEGERLLEPEEIREHAARQLGTPEIAVAVLNYNGLRYLADCFESLRAVTYPTDRLRIVFVDNGSTDGSTEYVRAQFPLVEVLEFPENLGFAGGYNEAIKRIDSPWILLLNNDVVVHADFISHLANTITRDTDGGVSVVGSMLLLHSNRKMIDYAGGLLSFTGEGFPSLHGFPHKPEECHARRVGSAGGASMLVNRDIFLSIGGFDSDYFAFCEETDFCWRAILAGYGVFEAPDSLVYHKVGGTAGQLDFGNAFRLRLAERNRLTSIVKNFSLPFLFAAIFVSITYDAVRILLMLTRSEWSGIKALGQGQLEFLMNLKRTLAKRRMVQRTRRRSDRSLLDEKLLAGIRQSLDYAHRRLRSY